MLQKYVNTLNILRFEVLKLHNAKPWHSTIKHFFAIFVLRIFIYYKSINQTT